MIRAIAILSILIITFSFSAHSQNGFVYEKSILTGPNKGNKFSKEFLLWIEKQTAVEIVSNNKEDSIVAKGKFAFENTVVYPGSATISRTYMGQTNGSVIYKVAFICREDQYIIRFYDFEHKPSGQSDVIIFGKITNAQNPPDYLMMDYDSDWCLNVWKYMKEQCVSSSSSFILQLQNEMATVK